MKRFLSLLLVLILTLGLLPAQAAPLMTGEPGQSVETPEVVEPTPETPSVEPDADEEPPAELAATEKWMTVSGIEGGKICFDSSTGTITDCSESVTSANIPATINGVAVTSIGDWAFFGCSSLTGVTIPYGVTSIGSYAFSGCSSLTRVTIPYGVTSIGSYAFSGCSSLTRVTIPRSVTSMGSFSVFEGCPGLTSAGPIGSGCAIEFGWTKKIPDHAFDSCSSLVNVTIPDGVTSIGRWAFSGCSSLTSVTIPDSVSSIDDGAFSGCSGLTGVTIPQGVTSIGWRAFEGCSSLASVTIPRSVSSFRYSCNAFYNCPKLTSAGPIGSGCAIEFGWTEKIPDHAFDSCPSLISVTIPDGLTSIGSSAFSGCSGLIGVTIPDSVSSIGSGVFAGCKSLDHINVSAEHSYFCVQDGVLFSKDLKTLICYPCAKADTSYAIPESVTSIGGSAFSGCSSLASVTIPGSVTSIGGSAFSGCSSLASVTIPGSVTSIDSYAFSACSGLTRVTIPRSVTSMGSFSVFEGCPGLTSAGPIGSGCAIEFGWTKKIPDHAFDSCSSLVNVTIPDGVTSIGRWAFSGCSSLTSVTIPESVTSIDSYAFSYCSKLRSIEFLGNAPTTVSSEPFPSTQAGKFVIRYHQGTTGWTAPTWHSVYTLCIEEDIITEFSVLDASNQNAQGIVFTLKDSSSTAMVGGGYYGNNNGTVVIPATVSKDGKVYNVTSIGNQAFQGCSILTSVTVPASLTSVAGDAFDGCTSLERIVYNGTAAQLAKISSDGKLGGIPAYCTMTELTVSFDANGGSGSMENIILANIDTHVSTLPECAFTPPSLMQFKAWEINGKEYQPGDPVTLEAGATITALWKNCVHDGARTVIEEEVLKPGDCGNDGRKRVQSLCNICGQSVTEEVVIPATGAHTLGSTVTVKAPAGAVAGQGRKDCSVCGYKETFPLFEVRYRALNCAPSMPNVIYEGEAKLALPKCTLTPPEGYSFSCWEVGGARHAPGYIYTVAANTVITPVWELESVRFPITASTTPASVTVYTNQPIGCEIEAGYIPTRFILLDADEQVLLDKSFSSWLATSTLDDLLPTESGTYTVSYELAAYTQTTVAGQVIKQPTGQSEAYSRTLDLRAPGTPLSCDIQPDGSLRFGLSADRFSENGTAALATYSAEGAMLDIRTVAMSDMTEGCSKTAALKLEEGGTYKLFLLDGETGAPLLDALVGDTVVPKAQEEIIFELLRDYAKTGSYSSEFYQKAFSVGTRNAVILYHPPLDAAYIAYRDGDSAEVFLPFTKDGAQPGCRYSKRFLNASEPLTAIFEIDPATFDGKSIPAVHQYTSAKPSGFGTMQETQFAEDCRHGMTQLLIVLQAFLSQRDHSIEELGFSAFDPELFPSQNAAFNKLVLYATAKGGYSNTKVIESASGTVYTAKYVPGEQKVVLSIVVPDMNGSMTSPTADTRLTLYADMRTPYEVSMKFFRYSGLASASVEPASYTKNSTIRLDPPNASNYDWATECRDWVNMILDDTTTLVLFDLNSDAMLLDYYNLDDLGFTSYES